jgi:hypothetical protein
MMILSICDYSGSWSGAFRELGYTTIQVDPKLHTCLVGQQITIGCTVKEFIDEYLDFYACDITGLLLAPPCTHFSRAGSRFYKQKDANGKTEQDLQIVKDCLTVKDSLPNLKFWCLENAVGRLFKLIPLGITFTFNPCEFAGLADDPEWESYNKRTCLWGNYEYPIKEPRNRRTATTKSGFGEILIKSGKDTPETKELRSKTPQGFSRAFAIEQLRRLV